MFPLMHRALLVLLTVLAGCGGLPPAELRERPIVATWTVATEPSLTAQCIARDIETEFYDHSARASIHPGFVTGEYEVFNFLTMSMLPLPFYWEELSALFTVQPSGGGSKILYRQASDSSWHRARVFRASKNWKCVK